MINTYLSINGRITAQAFRRHIAITSALGLGAAIALSVVLFGTWVLPIPPFMPKPDPFHQMLYTALPILFSAPLFIKRQHDRNRTPVLFALFAGLSVGVGLFGDAGSTATHPVTHGEINAFVARHVVQAPITLVGLWLLVECCLLEGSNGRNRYGPDPRAQKTA